MKKAYKTALSLMVVLAMITTVFFVMPVSAENQDQKRISVLTPNPSGVTFYDVAWKENGYPYAIAVGNDSSGNGVVYKFEYEWINGNGEQPTWTEITNGTKSGEVYMDVVYDTSSGTDIFYYVGTKTGTPGNAVAYKLDASTGQVTDLNLATRITATKSFNGACFDPTYGTQGALVAVGNDTSDNGLIAYYNVSGNSWGSNTTKAGDVLEAVTSEGSSRIYAVGYNNGRGIAYRYDYKKYTVISSVPSNAGAFYGIDWQPSPYEGRGYALVVGSDNGGYGFVWGLFDDNGTNSIGNATGINPGCPVLRDVDWKDDGTMAAIVGDSGAIYMYYDSQGGKVIDWSDPSVTHNLYGVAVKSPGSPGYGLGVGVSSTSKISYQVADSSTQIRLDTAYPHLTRIDFRDSAGNSKLNKQVDVGSTYYFLIDGYYMVNGADSWSSVNISIRAWYDADSEIQNFSSAPQGGNIRFRLDYNGTAWKLVEPTTEEIKLGTAGTETTSTDGNGNVHHILSINITFGPQVRYAPGDGTWDGSSNEHNATISFNDQNSWNFNITAFDRDHPTAGDSMYDEFGIFAYTEVSASQNPYGAGPPGTNITLNPSSRVVVSTNIDYHVSVNVTDLKNATGGHTISRTNIWVNNTNTSSNSSSQIYKWTNFTGNNKLWVWGTCSGNSLHYLAPSDNGIYTVENSGYNTIAYTAVEWKVYVPAGTPEDYFTATITYEISYP